MRRLFHGRMITVDGHGRRMYDDYSNFVIDETNYSATTKTENEAQEDSSTEE